MSCNIIFAQMSYDELVKKNVLGWKSMFYNLKQNR